METKEAFGLAKEEIAKRIKHLEEYIADQERGPDSDQEKKFYHWENIPNAKIEIADLERQRELMIKIEEVCIAPNFNLLLDTVKLLSSVRILWTKKKIEDPQITTTVGTWWLKDELSYYEELVNKTRDLLSRAKKKEELIENLKKI
jgi:hypothetical protein